MAHPGRLCFGPMSTPTSLETRDCTLAYETVGEEQGPPIVLLHGFGMSRAAMAPLARSLRTRGCARRCILVDLRGHGATRAAAREEAMSYPAMRDDLLALLEREAVGGAHCVGHSMGGQIALLAAIARPDLVRSLTLLGAGPCRAVVDERERRRWQRAAEAFESARPQALAASLAAAAPSTEAALTAEHLYGTARGADLARIVRGGFLTLASNDDECRRLAAPTLLLAGAHDEGWLEPTRKLARLVPSSELHVEDGAGHLLPLERPDACADRIARFLASVV